MQRPQILAPFDDAAAAGEQLSALFGKAGGLGGFLRTEAGPFSANNENNVPVNVIVRVPSVLSPALSPEPICLYATLAPRLAMSAIA